MDDRQRQDLKTVDLTESQLQQVQAGRDSIAAQNSQITINRSFISWFGDRQASTGMDWDWAARVLASQLTDIQKRLKDVLLEDQLLSIDAEERLDFVGRSPLASMRELKVGRSVETVNPDRLMIEMFGRKDVGEKLLILGRPGAGKTTALLGLAEQLVCGAIANPRTVIPVIFELSAWKDDGQSIEDFLIDQLYDNVGGDRRKRIYETWLEQRLLLPLLDGLDELGIERQYKCTLKLNKFARTYPQVVVCCRLWEFEVVGVDLNQLNGAIVLQPLSNQQIQDYLVTVNRSGLWQQIMNTPEMALMLEPDEEGEPGLLRVPLFISIAATIYDGEQSFRNKGDLLEKYIERQLSFDVRSGDRSRKEFTGRNWAFKTTDNELDTRSVKKYLTWLSKKLGDAEITDFQVKFLTHNWMRNIDFEDRQLRKKPIIWLDSKTRRVCNSLLFLLLPFLVWNITSVYLYFLSDTIIAILSTAISFVVSFILCGLIGYGIISVVVYMSSGFSLISEVLYLFEGFIQFAFKHFRALFYKANDLMSGIGIYKYLFVASPIAATFINLATFIDQHLMPIYAKIAVSYLGFITNFLPVSSLIGWLGGSISGMILGLAFTFKGFKDRKGRYPNSSTEENETSTDFTYSARWYWYLSTTYIHALYGLGLYIYYKSGTVISIHASISALIPLLPLGIVLIIYIVNYMMSGGYLGQLPIRLLLCWQGKIPWNYTRFLNYCAERRLLQRIGGRYRFIHRELLDHFGMKN